VGPARQDRELIGGAGGAVEASVTLTTAEQAVEGDDVLGSNCIGVGIDDEHRHLEGGVNLYAYVANRVANTLLAARFIYQDGRIL